MSLDLLLDLLVLLLNHVNLGVDLVHVVVKGIILLVSLDEGRHNFLDGGNTRLLLDGGEGILNNVNVSNVHVHEVLLFFIVVGPLLQSQLKESGWVGEFAGCRGRGVSWSSCSLALCLLELCVILLSQFLLQLFDTILELVLLLLILGFQGKNLIVEFLRHSLTIVRYMIQLEGLVSNLLHFLVVVVVHALLVLLLLAHHIDLVSQALVLRLQLVQILVVLIELVLKHLNLGGVLLDLGCRWSLPLEMLLFLVQLGQCLLVGVLQDHESLLFVLELGGEVVGLSLQASDLTLVLSSHPRLVRVTIVHSHL